MPQDKFKEGDIFEVDLPSGYRGFGQVLPSNFAFLDFFKGEGEDVGIEEISSAPVAFKIWVSYFALNNGLWRVVGNTEIPKEHKGKVFFYKQDPVSNQLWKTESGSEEYPVTMEECRHLEVAAVWDPEHVVERLENFRVGKVDPYTEFERKRLLEKGIPTA